MIISLVYHNTRMDQSKESIEAILSEKRIDHISIIYQSKVSEFYYRVNMHRNFHPHCDFNEPTYRKSKFVERQSQAQNRKIP